MVARALAFGPRARVAFLLVIAGAMMAARAPLPALALAGAVLALWVTASLASRRRAGAPWSTALSRTAAPLLKLWGLLLFLLFSSLFFGEDGEADRWARLTLPFGLELPYQAGGLTAGAVLFLRALALILASQLARLGDPLAIGRGLGGLGVPALPARVIEVVLALLPGGGHGAGRGGGRGTGRRGQPADGAPEREGFWPALARLARGDLSGVVRRLEGHLGRASELLQRDAPLSLGPGQAREAAVIAALALSMLGVKALKILPAIPFAPGHKLVLLTPLYFLAAALTRGRFGATLTGLAMGTVAFLLGDGKYGVFEILKHLAPGLLADLLLPLLSRAFGPRPPAWAWGLAGALLAAGRFATILAVVMLVQTPALALAMLVPGLLVHGTFGAASGIVTGPLLAAARARGLLGPAEAQDEPEALALPAEAEQRRSR